MTVQVSGTYSVSYTIYWEQYVNTGEPCGGMSLFARVLINGSTAMVGSSADQSQCYRAGDTFNLTTMAYLNAGDSIQFEAFSNYGTVPYYWAQLAVQRVGI